MRNTAFAVLILLSPFAGNAQYYGGANDGIAITNAGVQNSSPSIFFGGANDGHASTAALQQNATPSIFLGGSNDGHAVLFAANQNPTPGIFTGGASDGYAVATSALQNPTPGIFVGGFNDGFASVLSPAQNPTPSIFLGGANDGFSMQHVALQNPLPDVYKGGGDDGYAAQLSIGQNPSSPLEIQLLSFSGEWFREDALLEWTTGVERNLGHFELERSEDDGTSFSTLALISPASSSGENRYRYLDVGAYYLSSAFLLYRLKSVSTSGEVAYSGIVKLMLNATAPSFAVFPNPTTGWLSLSMTHVRDYEHYSYYVMSVEGKVLSKGTLQQDKTQIDLRGLSASYYFIVLLHKGEPIQRFKILLTE